MQLFLIAPAIVYLIFRFKIKIIAALVALIAVCIGHTVSLYVDHNFTTL